MVNNGCLKSEQLWTVSLNGCTALVLLTSLVPVFSLCGATQCLTGRAAVVSCFRFTGQLRKAE